jgi:phage tail sheath protein FI
MPVAPTYPGVYVEEIPSGAHPIVGVPTAVGAFMGWFPKGPRDEAVELLSWADVEREFGGLHLNSDASFALYQFFLNGGARAYAVRVAKDGAAAADKLQPAQVTIPAVGGGDAFIATALSPGLWGNAITIQVVGPDTTTGPFGLIITLTSSASGRPAAVLQEKFVGLTTTSATSPSYLPDVINGTSKLITVAPSGLTYGTPQGSGATSTAAVPNLAALAAGRSFSLTVTDGSNVSTNTANFSGNALATSGDVAAYVQSAIRTANGSDPRWAQATVTALPGDFLQVLPGVGSAATLTFAGSATITALKLPTTAQVGAYALVGGQDGMVPAAGDYVGSAATNSGLFALENTDFTLLSIPAIANQISSNFDPFTTGGYITVVSNAIEYCHKKRALFLIDPPDDHTSVTEIQNWLVTNSDVRDSYSALYYPRLTVPDPTRNFADRTIGTSGTIAGLMARIDTNRGVWKAPAGTEATLRGIHSLTLELNDPENGVLNPLAINCLRTFPAYGNVSWGARTLAGSDAASSDYKYVPVRRLANFLESSLQIGLKWVVFEPNDEPLWSQIRLNVSVFMQSLFRQGAFAGKAPRDAYIVKCDSSTTTPDDQAKGVVNVLVGFAPVRPAEFVILQIQQIAGQTQA